LKKIIKMREMLKNQTGIVKKVMSSGDMGRRIREMGLVNDTPILITGRAPLKDPVAIKVRDCILTLRNNEADHIFVEVDDVESENIMGQRITIALSGNPNSGKSTLFNAITGARQHIANYPGVTVEKKFANIKLRDCDIEVVDLPGTYSLTAYSLEEIVARDFLIHERPDLVVDIVDASNLDRNLYLAVQLKELGAPLVIALNMVDVAADRGLEVDCEKLSLLFGVPVIPIVARSKKGINKLLDKVIETVLERPDWSSELISYGIDIDEFIDVIEGLLEKSSIDGGKYPRKWMALKYLEGDEKIREIVGEDAATGQEIDAVCKKICRHIKDTFGDEPESIVADHRYGYITGITKQSVKRKIESRLNFSDRIDSFLTNRVLGPLFMMLILYAIYQFTFWASGIPVEMLAVFFGWMKTGVSAFIPEGLLHSLIVSGIIDGVGGVLSFIPLIMFMFFAIAIMEDSGYMARVAYMLDRVLRWFGLHGNSVLPLILSGGISGGCAVPGVMATRILRDPKERIATLLVAPFMNCGAKLPVLAMLISAFFSKNQAKMMFVFTILSWVFALFAAKILRFTVLKGPNTPFVMELPPYRAPTMKGILIHMWEKTWQYIKKAGTVILGVSIIVWAMMTFPGMDQSRVRFYEDKRITAKAAFLTIPEIGNIIHDAYELDKFNILVDQYSRIMEENPDKISQLEDEPLFTTVQELYLPDGGQDSEAFFPSVYFAYREAINLAIGQEQQETLKGTIAGQIGQALEIFSRYIGFDYRTNIALVGGFAAKEMILSTLGTAYSLGEIDSDSSNSLATRLKKDPAWNPLVAFSLILFTMLYVPCFAALISIKKESSWGWAGFSVAFNLILAYLMCIVVYQTCSVLGLGI